MITISRPHFDQLQATITRLTSDQRNSDQAFTDMLASCRALQAENDVLRAVLAAQDEQMKALRATIIALKGKV